MAPFHCNCSDGKSISVIRGMTLPAYLPRAAPCDWQSSNIRSADRPCNEWQSVSAYRARGWSSFGRKAILFRAEIKAVRLRLKVLGDDVVNGALKATKRCERNAWCGVDCWWTTLWVAQSRQRLTLLVPCVDLHGTCVGNTITTTLMNFVTTAGRFATRPE